MKLLENFRNILYLIHTITIISINFNKYKHSTRIIFFTATKRFFQLYCTYNFSKGPSTLSHAAECNKMQPCHAAHYENNVDVNVARLRQSFCMPCSMKIWSAKCRSHQRFAVRHMMSGVSKLHQPVRKKKIRRSSLVSFHSFCNLCKKFLI